MSIATPPTVADRLAEENAAMNAHVLGRDISPLIEIEWLFGRDGALTARLPDGTWLAGCSVPRAAARAAFKTLIVRGTTACLLAPPHAAYIAAVLERLPPSQALIAIVPDATDYERLLACENFSTDLARPRLFFAAGPDWASALRDIFARHPGLPLPTQFLRVPGALSTTIDPLIAIAQPVFGAAGAAARKALHDLAVRSKASPGGPTCVVASPAFRLWDDAGRTLAAMAGVKALNLDEPIHASSLALARAAEGCSAIVMSDAGRADFSDIIAPEIPWVTWVTRGRVPARGGPADRLLLADALWRFRAVAAGWPTESVRVATWPAIALPPAPTDAPLAVAFDLPSFEAPAICEEFSSWRVLWDSIRRDLTAAPQALGSSADGYLTRWMTRTEVSDECFPRDLFLDNLIAPAFALGVARQMLGRGISLSLHGTGWEQDDICRPHVAGAIHSAETLRAVAAAASGLLDVFIGRSTHPVHAFDRPVVRCVGRSIDEWVLDARNVLSGKTLKAPDTQDALDFSTVLTP